MRVYIPVLRNQSGLVSSLAFIPEESFRSAWPFSDWGSEDYEDLAMAYAGMFSLGMHAENPENICLLADTPTPDSATFPSDSKTAIWPGRFVVAADVTAKQIGDKLDLPGAYRLLSLKTSQIVSYHLEEPDLLSSAQTLRILSPGLISRLISTPEIQGAAYEELDSLSAPPLATQTWEHLLGESLLWYDRSESALVLKATSVSA